MILVYLIITSAKAKQRKKLCFWISQSIMVMCAGAVGCSLVDQDVALTLLPAVVQSSSGQTRDLTRDVGNRDAVCAGRKTVRFADESAESSSSTLNAVERPSNDCGRPPPSVATPADVGYTIRPHYPTRVSLSTFNSNSPTISPSELWSLHHVTSTWRVSLHGVTWLLCWCRTLFHSSRCIYLHVCIYHSCDSVHHVM